MNVVCNFVSSDRTRNERGGSLSESTRHVLGAELKGTKKKKTSYKKKTTENLKTLNENVEKKETAVPLALQQQGDTHLNDSAIATGDRLKSN